MIFHRYKSKYIHKYGEQKSEVQTGSRVHVHSGVLRNDHQPVFGRDPQRKRAEVLEARLRHWNRVAAAQENLLPVALLDSAHDPCHLCKINFKVSKIPPPHFL